MKPINRSLHRRSQSHSLFVPDFADLSSSCTLALQASSKGGRDRLVRAIREVPPALSCATFPKRINIVAVVSLLERRMQQPRVLCRPKSTEMEVFVSS